MSWSNGGLKSAKQARKDAFESIEEQLRGVIDYSESSMFKNATWILSNGKNGKGMILFLNLWKNSFGWGWKIIPESMGIRSLDCPTSYLDDAAEMKNKNWRKAVLAYNYFDALSETEGTPDINDIVSYL